VTNWSPERTEIVVTLILRLPKSFRKALLKPLTRRQLCVCVTRKVELLTYLQYFHV